MAKRVFKQYIGPWPKVYQTGNNAYEVVARYKDARLMHWMAAISSIPGILLAVWMLPQMDKYNWVYVICGAILGHIFLKLILRNVLTDLPFLTSRTTRIRFENGKIQWGRDVVPADMPRQFRTDRHRGKDREIRKTRPNDKTALPIYEFSTEVFVDTGEAWMHPRLVAEIARDETGQKGHLLAGALRFVNNRSITQAMTATREKMKEGLD